MSTSVRLEDGAAPGARERVPVRVNLALSTALAAAALVQLLAIPFLLPLSLHWAWLGVGFALLSNTHWSLVHEGMHGSLHPAARTNERWARMLAALFGISFYVVRFGHLIHHRFNRCPVDRAEAYDPTRTAWWRAAPPYYLHLCGGLYAAEIGGTAATLLPRPLLRRVVAWQLGETDPQVRTIQRLALWVVDGPQLQRMRVDAVATAGLYGASALLYGRFWPVAVSVLALRGFLLSVADNSYHYGTRLDSGHYARNLALPRWGALALLNFNLHHVHHLQPSLPWIALPRALPPERKVMEPYWKAQLRQFRGPLPLSSLSG